MASEIVIPRSGWSMEEGTFVGWLRQDGDHIRRGDVVFELEGEKAIQDVEAVDEGILHIPPEGPAPGSTVRVGAVVGYLLKPGEPPPARPAPEPSTAPHRKNPPPAAPSVRRLARSRGVDLATVGGTGPSGRILLSDVPQTDSAAKLPGKRAPFASPRARRIAAELGIDWTSLSGTGADGRIRERDVRAAAQSVSSSRIADGERRQPLTGRQQVSAQRLQTSREQTVPVTLTARVDATNLVSLREQFKAVEGSTPVPAYQDIIIRLLGEVLKRHPRLAGRRDQEALILPAENDLHIGMAVDTEDGLVVPVIRNAGRRSLVDLAAESRRLIEKARAGRLSVVDVQGAVFTVTNLGMYGTETFTPVINFPEVAILGLGAIRLEPSVLDDGRMEARPQLPLSLTFDHRVIDGAPAARFLQTLIGAIANPSAWLLSQ